MWGVPSYWLATILIYIFAIKYHVFPPALVANGQVTGLSPSAIVDILGHSFLPILDSGNFEPAPLHAGHAQLNG